MFTFKRKHTMAVKTITITEDAYNALKRMKYGDRSFSEVIIEFAGEKVNPVVKYFGVLKHRHKELDELRKRIKERRQEIDKESKERARKIRERFYGRS